MRQFSRWWCLLVILALIVPSFAAQDVKKGEDKKKAEAKKEVDKKEPAKKEENEAKEKKAELKGKEPTVVVFGEVMKDVTFKQFEGDNKVEFTVETWKVDKEKMAEFQKWKVSLLRGGLKGLKQFQEQKAQKEKEMMSSADMKLKAGENVVVRSVKPLVLDDQGNPKKLTKNEEKALKGSGKLPGYQAGPEALQAGVVVDVYFAKVKGPAPTKGKKKADDADLGGVAAAKPDVVMIMIKAQPVELPPAKKK